jgi:hypothetical protein
MVKNLRRNVALPNHGVNRDAGGSFGSDEPLAAGKQLTALDWRQQNRLEGDRQWTIRCDDRRREHVDDRHGRVVPTRNRYGLVQRRSGMV